MPLQTYSDLTAAIGNWLQRSDLTALLPNFVQLFEATANRRLRVRQQEAIAILRPVTAFSVTGGGQNLSFGPLGEIVLTVGDGSASSVAGLTSGDGVAIAGIVGLTGANGSPSIQVVTSGALGRVVLLGTIVTDTYVSGGTLTDTGSVALPSDYLAWRRVTWMGNPRRELAFVHPSILASRFPNAPIDLPSEFTIEGGVLRVMPRDPTPLTLLYWQKIPSLQASSTNWLMTEHPDLYLFGSLVEAQDYAVNVETAALWKARRDELFDEIEKLSNKSRGAGAVRTLGPTP
jgi:hypothetical protein